MKLIKNDDANIGGTSFHNSTFKATKNELIKLFGNPSCESGDIDDKVQNEWDFDLIDEENEDNNTAISIYDWKKYYDYGPETKIEWHIGGFNSEATNTALTIILNLLKHN